MCLICSRIEMIAKNQNPYFVKELRTGYVVLGDHQHFRGYTLFLGKNHITELDQLDREERNLFLSDMADVAEAVKVAFGADKMNCELLGNGDAHVHWHLFPRRSGDLGEYGHEGKGPVWWYPMELMYDEDKKPTANDLALMKQDLLNALEKIGV
ncbi:HIT family protein [Streptococcus sp. HF-1907]|uniref:HIT family protein n=1 Tax=Streptococcus sp. HF-1907 TaxID=2785793 RepID=UPI00189DEA18|nr:HIT family protein [Streptococcus sp. HF-1907]MBF7094376.1 HIT family protein [Streptococcus sp. HF-1907]